MDVQYGELIRRIAYQLIPGSRTEIDVLAKTREDYESELVEKAWRVAQRYHEERAEASQSEAQQYVCRSLWMQLRSFRRARAPRVRLSHLFPSLEEVSEEEGAVDFGEGDWWLEARDYVAKLRAELTPEEWRLVQRLGDAWCGSRSRLQVEVFDSESDGSPRSLRRRVEALRRKAITLIPELGDR